MNAPKEILICHLVWKIRFVNGEALPDQKKKGVTQLGEADAIKCVISLAADQDNQTLLDTAIHELIHAIWQTYNWASRLDQESLASMLPGALLRLYLDNPELMKWLKSLT